LHGEKVSLPGVVPLPVAEKHDKAYTDTLANMANNIKQSLKSGGLSASDIHNLLFHGD